MALFATDKLLVCAPRWKQTYTNTDIVWYRGRCSLLDSQFKTQYSFAPCEQGTKPVVKNVHLVDIYLFRVNNKNNRTKY